MVTNPLSVANSNDRSPRNESTFVFSRSGGNGVETNALSPPSDSGGIYDSHCFATTPSSSNGNCSDLDLPRQVTSFKTKSVIMSHYSSPLM